MRLGVHAGPFTASTRGLGAHAGPFSVHTGGRRSSGSSGGGVLPFIAAAFFISWPYMIGEALGGHILGWICEVPWMLFMGLLAVGLVVSKFEAKKPAAAPKPVAPKCLHLQTVNVENDGEVVAQLCLGCDAQLLAGGRMPVPPVPLSGPRRSAPKRLGNRQHARSRRPK
jgi:hypothetical protein